MDSKNKFWRGVMVGVLVTALVCLIPVGASAACFGGYLHVWTPCDR